MNEEHDRESRRSKVRIRITYLAALFLFAGGACFIGALAWSGDWGAAKDLFMSILPISAAIISYWFAGRKPKSETPYKEHGEDQDGQSKIIDQ